MASWPRIARRIRVPLSFAYAGLFIYLAKPSWQSIAVGSLILVPGLLTRALASGHVRKNEELATSGPYAYTRNPLYLGSFILAIGFATAARSLWIAALMLVMFFLIYLPVIRGEESFLRDRFPEFREYERAVPRLLPRLKPYGADTVSFSKSLYFKHREYNAAIGSVSMILALLGKLWWSSRR